MAIQATLRKSPPAAQATVDVKATAAETVPGDDFDRIAGVEETTTVGVCDPASALTVSAPKPVEKYSEMSDGSVAGEFDESDFRHPTLRIVAGSGELSNQFPQGAVIINEDIVLPPPELKVANPDHVFRFVPLTIEKSYRENLTPDQQAAKIMPRVVKTLREVEAAGGTTKWLGDTKPSWSPSARALLLVEAPKNCEHPRFVIPFGDKLYALAVYYSSGQSYWSFASLIVDAAVTSLLVPVLDENGQPERTPKGFPKMKSLLHKRFWTWRTVKKPLKNGFSVWVPEIRLHKEDTSAEIRDFVDQLLHSEREESPTPSA